MVRRLDFLPAETDETTLGLARLAGLRPAFDMPEWGFDRDPSSPFTANQSMDALCEIWGGLERCGEGIMVSSHLTGACITELGPAGTAYPAGFAAPTTNTPIACTPSNDLSQVTEPEDFWYPFEIELPRESDFCNYDPGLLESQARARLRDLVQLAVTRKLWGPGDPAGADAAKAVEPRGLSVGKFMHNVSAPGVPAEPIGAWWTLVTNVEADDWVEYTILAPIGALAAMRKQEVARPSGDGWVDPYGMPIVFGGQLQGWYPTSLRRSPDAPAAPEAPAAGEGYLVAVTSPVWFGLSEVRNGGGSNATAAQAPATELLGGRRIEPLANQVMTKPYCVGGVWTKSCNAYGIRTLFHSVG